MSYVSNLKIATKIVGLLVMLGLVVMAVAWYGSNTLSRANTEYSELTDHRLPSAVKLARVVRMAATMDLSAYRAMAYDGASVQAKSAEALEQTAYSQATDLLNKTDIELPGMAVKLRPVRASIDQLHEFTRHAIALGMQNKNDEARVVLTKADALIDVLTPKMVALNDEIIGSAKTTSAALIVQSSTTSMMMLLGGALAVILAVGGGIIVARVGITGPINRLKDTMAAVAGGANDVEVPGTERRDEVGEMAKTVLVFRDAAVALATATAAKQRADADQAVVVSELTTNLHKMSDGDLTARIDADVAPEYLDLKNNFNEALAKLRELIGAVGESALTIQTGSGEIAQASEDLARRTESNAASLEETAASITQMDARLRASATAASQTVERADQAIATVGGGRAVADEAVQAMGRVSESAKGIDSVIEGLDKIAFQTRVLAMNAAVEAGRAGDAGRGFAVVADLVSALAMRAEEEAKRARDQLTVTQTDIVTAVEAVQKVDGALANISGDVGQVHNLLATMAADNQAQSAAITQISAAVGTMDQSTQQNAAMVEETSAAARNLASEVGNLSDQASRFKVIEGGSRRPAQATRKPDYASPASYTSPIKPLPGAAISALVRTDSEDWNSF